MIDVYWANEGKNIIRLDYSAPIVSWEEYQDAIDRACDMAQSVQYPVCFIHNPGSVSMPAGNAIEQVQIAGRKTPANVALVLMVIHNRLARKVVQSALFIMRFPHPYKIVQSLEEAELLLADELSLGS